MWRMVLVFLPLAAVSVPKKKRKMKDLNKKEAVGDLLDAFTEVCACTKFMYSFISMLLLPVLMIVQFHNSLYNPNQPPNITVAEF